MAQQIGQALATKATASPAQSTVGWDSADLTVLTKPGRFTDADLATAEFIADLPVPPLPPSDETHFLRCMRTLRLLPTRGDDELSGELRVALYRKHFGHYPAAALSHLVERATITCRFFPTPAECKEILDQWERTDGPYRASQLARQRVGQELQLRFDELAARLREGEVEQSEIDHQPDRWKRILATQGYLRDDGTYAIRRKPAGKEGP